MPDILDNSPLRQIILTEEQISFITCALRDCSDAAYKRIKGRIEPEDLKLELGIIRENQELAQFLETQLGSALSQLSVGSPPIDEDVPQEVMEYLVEGNSHEDLVELIWRNMDSFERNALRAEIVQMRQELAKEG